VPRHGQVVAEHSEDIVASIALQVTAGEEHSTTTLGRVAHLDKPGQRGDLSIRSQHNPTHRASHDQFFVLDGCHILSQIGMKD
jgi:hypothetical protein